MEALTHFLLTTAWLFWKAFWAIALWYAFSAIIQIFLTKETISKNLAWGWIKNLTKASLLWFISSSCSFAALSWTKNLYTKWASLNSALAYMFSSTNLAIEVAILTYIFLGWQYTLALFVWAPIIITIQSLIVKLTRPKNLEKYALEHAKNVSSHEMEFSKDLPKDFKQKIKTKKTWEKLGTSYKSEWKMVYKEIFIWFIIAWIIATFVPNSFFESIFPKNLPDWLEVIVHSIIAPFIAIITFIWSMWNWPLAAVLAGNWVMFWAIMTFLYADFNVPPSVKINANYYWWKFSTYLAVVTWVSAILTWIIVHFIFKAFQILPDWAKSIEELSKFQIDYTFWLNIFSIIILLILFYLARKDKKS